VRGDKVGVSSQVATGVFSALRERDFRRLWLGSLSAFIGFFTSIVVTSVVAFELTGRNSAVGLVIFGRGLSMLALGPFGGAYADRVSKKLILLVSQSATTLVFWWQAALLYAGKLTVPHLVIGAFLAGGTFAFLGPTRQAYVIELIASERRGNAIALNQVALNMSRLLGPALAGALLAWDASGAMGAFVAMGALYALAGLTQSGLPPSPGRADAAGSVLGDVAEGLVYLRSRSRLRLLLVFFVLVIMLGFPHVSVLPGFVENVLGRDVEEVSFLFGVSAFGGLLSSLALAPMADSRHALTIYVGTGFLFGASLIALAATTSFWPAVVTMFAIGAASGGVFTLNGAVLLRECDERYYGRVVSLAMLAFAGFGIMGPPVGWAADEFGERTLLLISGLAVVVTALFVAAMLRRASMRVDGT
jgi:MFS family permease